MLDRIGRLMDGVRQVSNAIAHDLRTPITRARARLEDAAAARPGRGRSARRDRARARPISTAWSRCSRRCCGSPRSRPAPAARRSRRSIWRRCCPIWRKLYGAVAEEVGQSLLPDIAPTLPVYGDREMFQQAVANLLDNALKFSPPDGQIVLRAVPEAGGARIEVRDQGPGIPEADRARATERFFRGESARSTPGSGLGLALVQAVATLHGGTLVLSDNHPGLRAVLHLPAVALRAAEQATLPASVP